MPGGTGESTAGLPGEDVRPPLQSVQAQGGAAAHPGLQRAPGQASRDRSRPQGSHLQQGKSRHCSGYVS